MTAKQDTILERTADSHHYLLKQLDMSGNDDTSPRQLFSGRYTQRRRPRSLSPTPRTTGVPCDYSYSVSVSRLRNLLQQTDTTLHASPPSSPRQARLRYQQPTSPGPRSFSHSLPQPLYNIPTQMPHAEIPDPEQMLPLLQNQGAMIVQLEKENGYVRDEAKFLQQKVRELVEENVNLNEEVKRKFMDEMLIEGVSGPWTKSEYRLNAMQELDAVLDNKKLTLADYTRWHAELNRLKNLHAAKADRLETQLAHAKSELKGYEKETETLRSKLRVQEALQVAMGNETVPLAAGLCIQCAQGEAMLPATFANQKKVIEKLTSERDELMNRLTNHQARIEELNTREEMSYEQVKRSVEMVEQAQLEQTQALVEREQLKEELSSMRERMSQHVEQVTARLQQERDAARAESRAECTELNKQIKELTESMMEAQNMLDKTTREKMTLTAELEAARESAHDVDTYGKPLGSMKMTLTSAGLERDAAVRELKRLHQEMDQMTTDRDYERQRLKSELSDVRRRLDVAEKQLVEAKEQCIQLTTLNQSLERDAHLAKIARENVEKSRSDDVRSVTRRADQREIELNDIIASMESKHAGQILEMEELLTTQGRIVIKLREECKHLTNKLDQSLHKYRSDNKNLKSVNVQLKGQVVRLTDRIKNLEEKSIQHGELQQKMRERLHQMDTHAQRGNAQVLELLAKETALIRDRQLLAREVEFLRGQIMPIPNACDTDKLYSTTHNIIDDILDSVKSDEFKLRQDTPCDLEDGAVHKQGEGVGSDDNTVGEADILGDEDKS